MVDHLHSTHGKTHDKCRRRRYQPTESDLVLSFQTDSIKRDGLTVSSPACFFFLTNSFCSLGVPAEPTPLLLSVLFFLFPAPTGREIEEHSFMHHSANHHPFNSNQPPTWLNAAGATKHQKLPFNGATTICAATAQRCFRISGSELGQSAHAR